jgi:hypothetical protein
VEEYCRIVYCGKGAIQEFPEHKNKHLLSLYFSEFIEQLRKVGNQEIFMAVTMKNAIFWDITPCGSCKNRRFGGMYRLNRQADKSQRVRKEASSNWRLKTDAFSLIVRCWRKKWSIFRQ